MEANQKRNIAYLTEADNFETEIDFLGIKKSGPLFSKHAEKVNTFLHI
jgi:hypothetical protein